MLEMVVSSSLVAIQSLLKLYIVLTYHYLLYQHHYRILHSMICQVGEHPTQALLDMFTIWDELGISLDVEGGERYEGAFSSKHTGPLVVVLLGDLKHGRTVHSLAKLLARSSISAPTESPHKLILRYCSPKSLEMPSKVQDYVSEFDNVKQEEYTDMKEAVKGANVLYVTRVQKERFDTEEDYEKVKVSLETESESMQ